MKKILLTLAAVTIAGSAAFADSPFISYRSAGNVSHSKAVRNADADVPEDGFIMFGYCNGYNSGLGTGSSKVNLSAAIEIPAAQIQEWGNSQLKKIRLAIGTSTQKELTIWVSDKLNTTALLYSQTVTLQTEDGWNEYTLDTPFDLSSVNGKVYVGYSITTKSASDYPIGTDGYSTKNTMADNIAINNSWDHIGSDFGAICIQAGVSGDNLPQNDLAVSDVSFYSIVKQGEPFPVTLYVINNGSNNVSAVSVSGTVEGESFSSLEAVLTPAVIGPGQNGTIEVTGLICRNEGAAVPVTVTVDKVNGADDHTVGDNTVSFTLASAENTYPGTVVVEEWTGTWCGWCPRGIVGMTYMEETYGEDNFIGIAVHGGDEMEPASYNAFLNRYAEGFPGCIVNRDPYYMFDPSKETLEYVYNLLKDQPAIAQVKVSSTYNVEEAKEIAVKADVDFVMNIPNGNYRVAFVLTENNVGPYKQTNYYAPSYNQGLKLEGWDDKPGTVSTMFNHVARTIKNVWGISRSLPSEINKGEVYSYETTIPVTDLGRDENGAPKVADCELIAFLIDYSTGEIINASKQNLAKVVAVKNFELAVSPLTISATRGNVAINGEYDTCEVYSIDGKTVAHANGTSTIALPSGIYIVKVTGVDGNIVTRKVAL